MDESFSTMSLRSRVQRGISAILVIVYAGCGLSSSLVNLTHYLHHFLEHTLYEHEHHHTSAAISPQAHGHTHSDLLDRFLQKIEQNEDPDHDHGQMTVILTEHMFSVSSPLLCFHPDAPGLTAESGRLDTLYVPKPLRPPPKDLI